MSVRIIAGLLKGMRLQVPQISRPTTVRMRTSLFDTISSYFFVNDLVWRDLHVLDCFAGSGALGMEAISRGCASCDFVEKSREAYRILQRNVRDLENVSVFYDDFMRYCDAMVSRKRYDLFFIDPPYNMYDLSRVLRAASSLACQQALYVVEVSSRAGDFDDSNACKTLAELMCVDIVEIELIKIIRIAGSVAVLFAQSRVDGASVARRP